MNANSVDGEGLRGHAALLEGLLWEVAASGVEHNDPRIGYLTVQINRDTWNEIKAAAAAREAEVKCCVWRKEVVMAGTFAFAGCCGETTTGRDAKSFAFCPYCGLPIRLEQP